MAARIVRTLVPFPLILLGVALLLYGAVFRGAAVEAQADGSGSTVAQSEGALIKDVTVGGLERDDSGEIKKTYTGEQAPAACPT